MILLRSNFWSKATNPQWDDRTVKGQVQDKKPCP